VTGEDASQAADEGQVAEPMFSLEAPQGDVPLPPLRDPQQVQLSWSSAAPVAVEPVAVESQATVVAEPAPTPVVEAPVAVELVAVVETTAPATVVEPVPAPAPEPVVAEPQPVGDAAAAPAAAPAAATPAPASPAPGGERV
jgi:hypothetical protein